MLGLKSKYLLQISVPLFTLFLLSCSNNVENPGIDCSLSDLSVAVTGQVRPDCNIEGALTVQASGGSGSFLYSLDGVNFQSAETFEGLSAGNYTITVKDIDGCLATVEERLESEPGGITLSLDAAASVCGESSGTISASATGGLEPYAFRIDGGSLQASGSFSGLSNGTKTITVTDDEGCSATRSIVVSSGISLATDIMPIISSNCAVTGCHNGSRSPDLRTSAQVMSNASRIRARTSAGTMPPADRGDLSQIQIDEIACWVNDGAPDN